MMNKKRDDWTPLEEHNYLMQIEYILDNIPQLNGLLPTNFYGSPPFDLNVDDFKPSIPMSLIQMGVKLVDVQYERPERGTLVEDVKLVFQYEDFQFIKTIDLEYPQSVVQGIMFDIDQEDIIVDPIILNKSPKALENVGTKGIKIKKTFPKTIIIRSFIIRNNHISRTPKVTLIIEARNIDYTSVAGTGPEFYTREMNFTPTFKHSDASYAFHAATNEIVVPSDVEAPAETVADFRLNYSELIDLGFEIGKPYATKGVQYDLNERLFSITIPLHIYSEYRDVEIKVEFKKSFNEGILSKLGPWDIKMIGLSAYSTTYDSNFGEWMFEKTLHCPNKIHGKLKQGSLERYPSDPHKFSGQLLLTRGLIRAEVPFVGKLDSFGQPINQLKSLTIDTDLMKIERIVE